MESDRGPWVQALLASGYVVFAINPMQVACHWERHSASGAKSDAADAHQLAEIVRLARAHRRPIAGDTEIAEHVKIATRAHQTMVCRFGVRALPHSLSSNRFSTFHHAT
jgi:hypothetical protein